MEEWKLTKIGSLCKRVCSGGTPKSTIEEYFGGDIPWLNTKEVNFNRIYSTESTISDAGLNNSSAKWIDKHSVIVAMYGATAAKCAIGMIPMTTNQACCNLMVDENLADYRFIYYALTNSYSTLASLANGGAQQNLNAQLIKDFEIPLPDLHTQHRIADILTSIDDKIENNNRINHNLEEQAQALYKSWFVDFEPFQEGEFVESELGLIPKGWKVVSLDSLCSIISRGFSPKYSESTTDVVLGQRCVRNNMIDLSVSKTHVPKNIGERALCRYDILINSTGMGSLGRVAQIYFKPERMTYDSHLTLVRAKSSTLEMYLGRNLLSRQDEIENMAVGSTGQTELPRDSVKAMSILLPCDTVLDQFGALIRAIAGRIQSNLEENVGLTAMRDYLLPKLMSGELKINDLAC